MCGGGIVEDGEDGALRHQITGCSDRGRADDWWDRGLTEMFAATPKKKKKMMIRNVSDFKPSLGRVVCCPH